jgi:hypothetical protein
MRERHEALLHHMLQLSYCCCTVACISASKHPSLLRFVFRDAEMVDDLSLWDQGVRDGDVLSLVISGPSDTNSLPARVMKYVRPWKPETSFVSGLMIRPRSAGLWQHDTTSCWTVLLCSMTSMCIVCSIGR